jgi:hypothetical protein
MTPFFARTGINQFDAPGILPYEIIGRWRTAGHLANRTVRMR